MERVESSDTKSVKRETVLDLKGAAKRAERLVQISFTGISRWGAPEIQEKRKR